MKAVLLDLDDTLYPEMSFVRSGFAAVAAHLAPKLDRSAAVIEARLAAILARDGRGRVFDSLLEQYGVHDALAPLVLLQIYRSHPPRIALDPEVRPTLAALRGRGLALGVITDGMGSVQRRKLAALGLDQQVDLVLCTDELGPRRGKPSEVPFRVALQLLGVPARSAVYVGDDDSKDFVAPRALGMRSVRSTRWRPLVESVPPSHRADGTIASLDALPALLQELT